MKRFRQMGTAAAREVSRLDEPMSNGNLCYNHELLIVLTKILLVRCSGMDSLLVVSDKT